MALGGGGGMHLGGGGVGAVADARAAALAAAEKRQASALSHGIGESKAKALREKDQREALIKRINEIYAKKREDVPMAVQSANLAGLQRHFDHLTEGSATRVAPLNTSSAPSSLASAVHPSSFRPPARIAGTNASAGGTGDATVGGELPLHPLAERALAGLRT